MSTRHQQTAANTPNVARSKHTLTLDITQPEPVHTTPQKTQPPITRKSNRPTKAPAYFRNCHWYNIVTKTISNCLYPLSSYISYNSVFKTQKIMPCLYPQLLNRPNIGTLPRVLVRWM